jgi:hypothetical protein
VLCCDISIYASNVTQFGSSPPLFSLFPFLKWLLQVSVFHTHTCVENTSIIFTLLYSLHLPSPPMRTLLLTCPALPSCLLLFSGVLPWYFTCKYIVLQSVKSLYYSSLPFPPIPPIPPILLIQFSVCFVVSCSCTDVNIIHCLFFSPSLFPPLASSDSSTFGNMIDIHIYTYTLNSVKDRVKRQFFKEDVWMVTRKKPKVIEKEMEKQIKPLTLIRSLLFLFLQKSRKLQGWRMRWNWNSVLGVEYKLCDCYGRV